MITSLGTVRQIAMKIAAVSALTSSAQWTKQHETFSNCIVLIAQCKPSMAHISLQ